MDLEGRLERGSVAKRPKNIFKAVESQLNGDYLLHQHLKNTIPRGTFPFMINVVNEEVDVARLVSDQSEARITYQDYFTDGRYKERKSQVELYIACLLFCNQAQNLTFIFALQRQKNMDKNFFASCRYAVLRIRSMEPLPAVASQHPKFVVLQC